MYLSFQIHDEPEGGCCCYKMSNSGMLLALTDEARATRLQRTAGKIHSIHIIELCELTDDITTHPYLRCDNE